MKPDIVAENSVQLYLALKRAKVPAELHVYTKGGHGFGLRPAGCSEAQTAKCLERARS